MDKCLVTRLKGVVEDDSLLKLGELRLKAVFIDTDQELKAQNAELGITVNKTTTISVDGDGYFATSFEGLSDPASRLTEYVIHTIGSRVYLYFKNGNYNISIDNKYNLNELYMYCMDFVGLTKTTVVNINLDDLVYLVNAEKLDFGYCGKMITGDISSLVTNTEVKWLNFGADSEVTGDIASVASSCLLDIISIHGTKVTGSVEDFVAGQIRLGRTSPLNEGTHIKCAGFLQNLTFGGTIKGGVWNNGIVWDGLNRIFVGVGGYVSFDASTTIYAKGATPEEIAAWEQSGKTVVVVN